MAPPRTTIALALLSTVLLLAGAPVAAQEESQEGGLPLVEQLAGLVWNRNVGSIDGGDAFRMQAERTVKDAVAAGANLDSMDHEGRTPLHWAAANGEVAVVQGPPGPVDLSETRPPPAPPRPLILPLPISHTDECLTCANPFVNRRWYRKGRI